MLVLVVFLIWAAVLRSFWGLIRGKEIEATFHNSTGNDFPKDSLESKNVAKKSKDQTNQTSTTPAGTSENAIASSSTTAGPVSSSPIISPNATTLRVPSVFARYHLSQDRSFLKSPVEKKLGKSGTFFAQSISCPPSSPTPTPRLLYTIQHTIIVFF